MRTATGKTLKIQRMTFKKIALSLVLVALVSLVATPILAKDLLPLEHGTYVQSRLDCDNPGGSMLFIYDGKSIKSGKTVCELSNLTNSGNIYSFDESCAYYHRSWSILPTTTSSFKTTLDVVNKREFRITRENENLEFNDEYRWCKAE